MDGRCSNNQSSHNSDWTCSAFPASAGPNGEPGSDPWATSAGLWQEAPSVPVPQRAWWEAESRVQALAHFLSGMFLSYLVSFFHGSFQSLLLLKPLKWFYDDWHSFSCSSAAHILVTMVFFTNSYHFWTPRLLSLSLSVWPQNSYQLITRSCWML